MGNKILVWVFLSLTCLSGVAGSLPDRIEKPVYIVDLWTLYDREGFDTLEKQVNATYFITALQGIVNRDEPLLFLDASLNLMAVELDDDHIPNRDKQKDFESMDRRWLEWLQSSGMLGNRPLVPVASFKQLVSLFGDQVQGLALWDMETPSSVNLALTAAGSENLLPLGMDLDGGFLKRKLDGSGMKGLRDFTGFTRKGVAGNMTGKELVYRTMLDEYLRTRRVSPFHLWFNLDAFAWRPPVVSYGGNRHLGNRNMIQHNGLYNSDYWVSKRALFVDLYSLDDEAPNDDPKQEPGTDVRLWNDILEESYRQREGEFGVLGGFAPWWVKYSDKVGNRHPPIAAEQSFIRLATSYNLWNDGDAAFGLSNASFYRHLPLPEPEAFTNPPVERPALREDTVYVCLFMLDYDGSAWLNQMAHAIYDHPGRGVLPLNWAINPILADRVPHVFRYLLENRTDKDFFRIADDGAGYIDPYYLLGENRTGRIRDDGFHAYRRAAKPYLERLNMDLMAFYISDREFTEEILAPIADLTPAGMGINRTPTLQSVGDVPVIYIPHYHHKERDAFENELARLFERGESGLMSPEFYAYRLILFRPGWLSGMVERLREAHPGAKVEFLDAHTFMALKQEGDRVPLVSPWMDEERLVARPGVSRGLEPAPSGDGPFHVDMESSPPVWRLESKGSGGRYFYFRADRAFSSRTQLAEGKRILVSVRSDQPATLGLEYNGMWPDGNFPNPYVTHPKRRQIHADGSFQEVVFELDRPYFQGTQNSMADFRFTLRGPGGIEVKSVTVEVR